MRMKLEGTEFNILKPIALCILENLQHDIFDRIMEAHNYPPELQMSHITIRNIYFDEQRDEVDLEYDSFCPGESIIEKNFCGSIQVESRDIISALQKVIQNWVPFYD